jgi:hypothetical protein
MITVSRRNDGHRRYLGRPAGTRSRRSSPVIAVNACLGVPAASRSRFVAWLAMSVVGQWRGSVG